MKILIIEFNKDNSAYVVGDLNGALYGFVVDDLARAVLESKQGVFGVDERPTIFGDVEFYCEPRFRAGHCRKRNNRPRPPH
jgi:hypothetical protein